MRKLIFLLPVFLCLKNSAQKNTVNNIIEGGRVVADILRIIKTPKNSVAYSAGIVQPSITTTDSCAAKSLANICYKNSSGKNLYITLYKRNGNVYAALPLTLVMPVNSKECLYEIQSGIYKYKIEYENEEEEKIILREGEMKIAACDDKQEELK